MRYMNTQTGDTNMATAAKKAATKSATPAAPTAVPTNLPAGITVLRQITKEGNRKAAFLKGIGFAVDCGNAPLFARHCSASLIP